MYILSFGMWFTKLVRQFFFLIDRVVFGFIPTIYNLLIDIARTSVLSQSDISIVSGRIYQLLAVFMVFKVTFSLIMYVVNPDDFSDKSKGVSKLGTNIVISLCLLVLTPYLFSYAYQIQTIILEDDSLGTLVFGNNNDDTSDKAMLTSAGDKIAYNALAPFFTPNTSISELMNCVSLKDTSGKFNQTCSGIDLAADEIYTGEEETLAGLAKATDGGDKLKYSPNYTETDVANYVTGVEVGSMGLMFRQNMIVATAKVGTGSAKEDQFVMEYKFIFSTAVGVIIVLLLLTFCMDVAVRSVKLSFLQLVAPIPILSYIDPKNGKDGMFKKWYQLCFKTYASLFIRLLSLYFGVFIIGRIDSISDVVNGSYQSSMYVKIFVIIGVLMFVKQLPKMLEGLGLKLDGGGKFTLNPIKKFKEEAFGGKQILGFGAAGAAGVAAGATNFLSRVAHPNSWKDEKGRFSWKKGLGNLAMAPGSAAAGMFSALRRGGQKAMKGEDMGKIFSNSYGEAMFAKLQREDLSRKHSTLHGRLAADMNRWTGNLNAAQRQELAAAQSEQEHNAIMQKLKDDKDSVSRQKAQIAQEKRVKQDPYTRRKGAYEQMQKTIDTFKSPGEVSFKTPDGRTHSTKINVKDADQYVKDLISNGEYYIKEGETFVDENGETRRATIEDVANAAAKGYKSAKGLNADKALERQRDLAYKYLSDTENMTDVGQSFRSYQSRIEGTFTEEERESGKVASRSYTDIKAGSVESQQAIEKINSDYYDQEQEIEAAEVQIADKEAAENERYIDELKELGLDKNSPQWAANEADNAARSVKSVQPEGFKPNADNAYTTYNTRFVLGSGPQGGPRNGSGGQPPRSGGPS